VSRNHDLNRIANGRCREHHRRIEILAFRHNFVAQPIATAPESRTRNDVHETWLHRDVHTDGGLIGVEDMTAESSRVGESCR